MKLFRINHSKSVYNWWSTQKDKHAPSRASWSKVSGSGSALGMLFPESRVFVFLWTSLVYTMIIKVIIDGYSQSSLHIIVRIILIMFTETILPLLLVNGW